MPQSGHKRPFASYHPERLLTQSQCVDGAVEQDESSTESEESIELNINFSCCRGAEESCDDSTLPPLQLEEMPQGYFTTRADSTTSDAERRTTEDKTTITPTARVDLSGGGDEKENMDTANAVEGAGAEDGIFFVDQPCLGGVAVVTPPLKRQRTVRSAGDLGAGEDLRMQWME
jgi:hypothetical protein